MKKYTLLLILPLVLFAADADKDIVRAPTSKAIVEFCSPVVPARTATRGATASLLATGSNWSDPATWGGAIPPDGSNVVIPAGMTVIIDQDINATLTIDGTVEVARRDTSVTSGYILVRSAGRFVAGSTAEPFANKLTITLTGADRSATPMGGRVFGAMGGGRIELIGKVPALTWTMLNATAQAGSTSLTLEAAPGWSVGDEIIITSTDFDYAQTEKHTITAISGTTVTLDSPLAHAHNGAIRTVAHNVAGVPTTIDERAEVGLITHRIKVQGAQGLPGIEDSETNGFGGHMMIMGDTSVALLQGVELYNMGQKGILGRYPMHWHNVNNGGANSWMKSCATHHSFQRGTTIHKTNGVSVSDCVIYDTLGHGYFFEDGKETGNILTHNLVAFVHKGILDVHWNVQGSAARIHGAPAAFWITNPNNTFIGNAAAGVIPTGFGFWFDLDSIPRPGSISADPSYAPNAQPFGVFKNNRSHSTDMPIGVPDEGGWGMWMDKMTYGGTPLIEGFKAFKNTKGQIWTNMTAIVSGASLSGGSVLFNPSILKDSLAYGGEFALDGYDFVAHADHSVFANFQAVYRLRNPAGEYVRNSTFINAPIIGNINNLTKEDAESRLFLVENPEDSFGNGAPGLFTYSELLTDASSKNAASGAKGIATTDAFAWWSPFLMTDFTKFHVFDNYGQAQFEVYVQPAGKTRVFKATHDGGSFNAYVRLDATHNITFGGAIQNETIVLNVWPTEAQAGRKMLLNLPLPSSNPIYTSDYRNVPVFQATSIAEFDAGTGVTVFPDSAARLLRVKLPVDLNALKIAGYTISDAPPPPPPPPPVGNPSDVDVFKYAITSTASKTGIDTIVAEITIKNRAGGNASGVTVSFAWSGIVQQVPAPVVTNRLGIARFTTKAKIAGTVTGTVTAVSGAYVPSIYEEPLSRSVTVP